MHDLHCMRSTHRPWYAVTIRGAQCWFLDDGVPWGGAVPFTFGTDAFRQSNRGLGCFAEVMGFACETARFFT